MTDEHLSTFQQLRPRLFGIAYRMLGTVEDAEDVVQETYLRWHGADESTVRSPEAWLVATTTRLAIDRARRAATERAAYEGRWLPEPLATPEVFAPERRTERESDLSMAFLLLLERLAPEERAAFLLREVLGVGYAEIAHILERTEAACRQMVHRARERVRDGKRRAIAPPLETRHRLVQQFVQALRAEDEEALLAVFADDVEWVSDGGGRTPAIREIVSGAKRVAKLAVGFERMGRGLVVHELALINGEPAVRTLFDGRTLFVTAFSLDGDRIAAVYRILNPDKLYRVGPPPVTDWREAWERVRATRASSTFKDSDPEFQGV